MKKIHKNFIIKHHAILKKISRNFWENFTQLLIEFHWILKKISSIFKDILGNFQKNFNQFLRGLLNDNLTSVLLAGPAVLPVLPLAKFNFDILVLPKDPYCILLLSVMPVDAELKKMMKFGWLGAEIWEFYSRRYFLHDIALVKLPLKLRRIPCNF